MVTAGPARNRVTPLGDIVAVVGRGAWMGNRGVLHQGRGARDIVRNSRNRAWITCALSFRGRELPQWEPGRYTQLFFLDEAVALAAGHRPCAECRRGDYHRYRSAWARTSPGPRGGEERPALPFANEMDAQLAQERADPRTGARRWHEAGWADLPEGTFVLLDAGPAVVLGDHLALWSPDNSYGRHLDRPRTGGATVVTPPAGVGVLRAGYPVQIDEAAR